MPVNLAGDRPSRKPGIRGGMAGGRGLDTHKGYPYKPVVYTGSLRQTSQVCQTCEVLLTLRGFHFPWRLMAGTTNQADTLVRPYRWWLIMAASE